MDGRRTIGEQKSSLRPLAQMSLNCNISLSVVHNGIKWTSLFLKWGTILALWPYFLFIFKDIEKAEVTYHRGGNRSHAGLMLVSSFNLFIHMAIEFKFIVFKKKIIRLSIFGIGIITSPAFEAVWRSSVTIRTTENTNFQRQLMLVCLFGVSHSRIFHTVTSPSPVKGCKFWPTLGTYGHWAVRVL